MIRKSRNCVKKCTIKINPAQPGFFYRLNRLITQMSSAMMTSTRMMPSAIPAWKMSPINSQPDAVIITSSKTMMRKKYFSMLFLW